jgi:hypothetical protein
MRVEACGMCRRSGEWSKESVKGAAGRRPTGVGRTALALFG